MKRISKRSQLWLCLLAIMLVVPGTFFAVSKGSDDYPVGTLGSEVSVHVANGQSGGEIATILQKAGVVKTAKAFLSVALSDPRSRSIAPGTHRVNTHIPAKLALEQMIDGKRIIGLIVVKEGSTLSDVLAILKSNTSISFPKSQKLAKVVPPIPNRLSSLEGMLFPAQYSFENGTSAEAAITSMAKQFKEVLVSSKLNQGFEKYDAYQVLTIASILQVEGDTGDFAKIARVILNRLSIGMPLQLNSTVQYAANLRGQIQLSKASTQIDSPYNTYRNIGLPPTPISNPGLAAIEAALHPASGDWLYFITVKPGDTRFTRSFSEFGNWEILFHKNLAAGAFK